MAYDSEVRIKTKLDNSGLSNGVAMSAKEIDRLTANFNKQTESIKKQSAAIEEMRRKLAAIEAGEKAPASLMAMESQLKKITAEIKQQEIAYAEIGQQVATTQENLSRATTIGRTDDIAHEQRMMRMLDDESLRMADALEDAKSKADALTNSIAQIKLDPAASSEAQALRDKIALAEGTLEGSKNKANELKDALRQAFAADPKPVENGAKRIGNSIGKAVAGVKRLGTATKNAGTHANKAASGFGLMSGRIMSLVKAAFVFNIIRRALSELQKYMGALLKSNKDFMASWNAIRVNLLTAFAPIWEVIQPMLIAFMQVLAKVTQMLATFVAMLFGKTYQQAKDSAKAMDKQAKSIDKVGGSAKKTSKQLMTFDEINQQIQESAEGAGDAADALDFEAVKFDLNPAIMDALQKLLDWLTPIWEAIKGAWSALLDSLKKAWERWRDAFLAAWKRLAAEVQRFLILIFNTFERVFRSEEWARFLDSIAKNLILILDTISEIIKAISDAWESQDRGYRFLQSIVYLWTEILELIHSTGRAFLDAWDNYGVSIVAHILEIWTNINNIIGTLAGKIREAWEANGNGEAIWNTILGIVDDILGHIDEMSAATLEWAQGLDLEPLVGAFRNLLEAIRPVVDIIMGGLAWAWENVVLPFGKWLAELAVPAALSLLTKAFGTLKEYLDAIKPAALWIWENFLKPLGEWTGEILIDALDFIGEKFDWLTKWIKDNGEVINKAFEMIGTTLSTVWSVMEPILSVAWEVLKGVVDGVITILGGLMQFLLGVFTGDWETAWEGIKNIFKGIFNGIVSILEGAINLIIKGINWMIDQLNKVSINIPDWLGGGKIGFTISHLGNVTIPRLALGGVVGHGIYELGENGAEAVVPLENNTGWINAIAAQMADEISNFSINPQVMNQLAEKGAKQGAAEWSDSSIAKLANSIVEGFAGIMTSLSAESKDGGQGVPLVLEIDGRELARATLHTHQTEARRLGVELSTI